MKSYQIHLIRHGLTEANSDGKYIGATNVELSDEGIKRLHKLKDNFSYPKADKVFSSPLVRCTHTAKILYPENEILIEKNFAECNFGEWEGKSAIDLKDNKEFAKWLNNSGEVTPKGGESLKDFTQRALVAFEKLVENAVKSGYKDTVIVTHGGVIMTIWLLTASLELNFMTGWLIMVVGTQLELCQVYGCVKKFAKCIQKSQTT